MLLKISYLNAVLQNVPNKNSATLNSYEIKQLQDYLNETKNSSVRRYKLVVAEYYKKYSDELSLDDIGVRGGDLRSCLVAFARMNLEGSTVQDN